MRLCGLALFFATFRLLFTQKACITPNNLDRRVSLFLRSFKKLTLPQISESRVTHFFIGKFWKYVSIEKWLDILAFCRLHRLLRILPHFFWWLCVDFLFYYGLYFFSFFTFSANKEREKVPKRERNQRCSLELLRFFARFFKTGFKKSSFKIWQFYATDKQLPLHYAPLAHTSQRLVYASLGKQCPKRA